MQNCEQEFFEKKKELNYKKFGVTSEMQFYLNLFRLYFMFCIIN